ncbi:MAG TPA: tetratricopeptide repeat protein [Bacteroidia bacterium]|nr:tetratricopeptide repeat protein [Bacteroidia bacterium]
MPYKLSALKEKLDHINNEIEKIDVIHDFFQLGFGGDLFPEESYRYSIDTLEMSRRLNYRKGEATALMNLAYYYWFTSGHDKGYEYMMDANRIFTESGEKKGEAVSLQLLSFLNWDMGHYEKAFSCNHDSMELCEKTGYKEFLGWNHYAYAVFYFDLKDYTKSLQHYETALPMFQELQNPIGICRVTSGIGSVYFALGDLDKALQYGREALKTNTEVGHGLGEARALNDIGNVYLRLGNTVEAEKYFLDSYKIREAANNRQSMNTSLLGLARLYIETKEYEKALESADKALECAEAIGVKHKIFQTHQMLSEIYKKMDDPWKSLDHFEKFFSVKSEVLDEQANNKLKNLETKHATEKAEKEAEIHKLRNVELREALEQLKKAQSQLVQSEKMASLGQLTAGVAHEINNPINFVSSNINPLKRDIDEIMTLLEKYSELDQKNYPGKLTEIMKIKDQIDLGYTVKEIKSLLSGIEEGSKRTAEIVKGLRNFSRLDEEDMKKANINEGISSTLVLLKSKLKHENIEVINSFGDLPEIDCYPGQLNQVFMNILSNAIDSIVETKTAHTKKKNIFIATSNEMDRIKISIRDTGKGMSEEVKQKIFDPFFTTKDVGKGTGLGLSISYGIIEKHKGTIKVRSDEQKGTEFIITLPFMKKNK